LRQGNIALIHSAAHRRKTKVLLPQQKLVMPGLVPGIHVLAASKTWMAGT